MTPNLRSLAALALGVLLHASNAVIASPAGDRPDQQVLLGPDDGPDTQPLPLHKTQRKLSGKFLHITDFHPDAFYKPHTSTGKNVACHRKKGPAGYYGAETSDCDSPISLVNATFDWIAENIADDIDFVIWTGDSARHDSDEKIPRNRDQVIDTNRMLADKFFETFKHPDSDSLMKVPVIPNLGNNDILPHNILRPGPTKWFQYYTQIWRHFIPEEQRHSFQFGGWFNVEVIPNKLSVFSLNTLYLFDRNAAVDGCGLPSEPGYKQMEWLRVQLQLLRERGMKAILMGHVPPARTDSKQNWDETCWQKYNLWMRQYRDVVVGSLYGHMNIDHFIAHDTKDIDLAFLGGASTDELAPHEEEEAVEGEEEKEKPALSSRSGPGEEEFSVKSARGYLKELRRRWSKLPGPKVKSLNDNINLDELLFDDEDEEEDVDDDDDDEAWETTGKKGKKGNKKKKKKKKKKLGKYAQRYHVSLISPSIVPNYFPTLRVFEYNITGMEDSAVWTDSFKPDKPVADVTEDDGIEPPLHEELKRDSVETEKKKKKGKGKKGKGKKPKDPNLNIPDKPSKSDLPGPAYSPQPLTLTGYTQYYANLTLINNDMMVRAEDEVGDDKSQDDFDSERWRDGIHKDKDPKTREPKPNPFKFEVEYSTFTDKIYKLSDLTVRSYVKLAYRIGQKPQKGKGKAAALDDEGFEDDEDDLEEVDHDDHGDEDRGEEGEEGEEEEEEEEGGVSAEGKRKKKKKHKKKNKVWMHFLNHAFVKTLPEKKLKKTG